MAVNDDALLPRALLRLGYRIKKPADCLTPTRLWLRLSVYPGVEFRRLFGIKAYCHAVALTGRFGWFCDAQLREQIVAGYAPDGVR
jgi:hypothetical protein